MSMHSWTVTGYGFCDRDLKKVTNETLLKFLRNHEKGKEVLEDIAFDEDSNPEIFRALLCDNAMEMGYDSEYYCIADVIEDETGLPMQAFMSNCTDEHFVLMCEGMPWNFDESIRTLTREEFKERLYPYAVELGISDATMDMEEVEYFG